MMKPECVEIRKYGNSSPEIRIVHFDQTTGYESGHLTETIYLHDGVFSVNSQGTALSISRDGLLWRSITLIGRDFIDHRLRQP